VQQLVTAGKPQWKWAAAWQKVRAKVTEVVLVCEAAHDDARKASWEAQLTRLETAFNEGGVAIVACSLI
jgi:hypothetical protein